MSAEEPWRIVLDTDIGSDVDDILALAMLFGEPDVELLGVTTAYGDTSLRARIVRRVYELSGRPDIPIAAGVVEPLTPVPIWWPGHEGDGIPGLEAAAPPLSRAAHEFLCDIARDNAGSIEIVAIAPLTNVALAVLHDPEFAQNVKHLWVMGGDFSPGAAAEHNFKCDPYAAWIALNAGIPTTICGLDITLQVDFGTVAAAALDQHGQVGAVLADQMRRWWRISGRGTGDPPHDPLTVLTRLEPDLFSFADVAVDVVGHGPSAGTTRAKAAPGSSLRVVTAVSPARAHDRILEALLRNPGGMVSS